MRPANKSHFAYFFNIYKKTQSYFFHFFNVSSLMRLPGPIEFETPALNYSNFGEKAEKNETLGGGVWV